MKIRFIRTDKTFVRTNQIRKIDFYIPEVSKCNLVISLYIFQSLVIYKNSHIKLMVFQSPS